MSSNSKKAPGGKDDKKNPSSKEESPSGGKDDGGSASTGSNGGTAAGDPSQPGSKPSSAGATAREGAQRLLGLAARGEWAPMDQLLKSLEKTVQSAGEDGFIVPLAGVLDPVSSIDMIAEKKVLSTKTKLMYLNKKNCRKNVKFLCGQNRSLARFILRKFW